MRPSQSICRGTAASCLAVKASPRVQSLLPCTVSGRWLARPLEMTRQIILLIHTRPEAVSPIERLLFLFDPVSVVSVPAPGSSLQVSPSVTCSVL